MNHSEPEAIPMNYSENICQELYTDPREQQRHEMDDMPMGANMHGGPAELGDVNVFGTSWIRPQCQWEGPDVL